MSVKPLFDAAELLKEETQRVVVDLPGLVSEATPSVTVEISEKIRTSYAALNKKYFDFYIELKGRGTRQKREGHTKSNPEQYAKELLELCIVDSSGLFDTHNLAALQKAVLKYSKFREYLIGEIEKVFTGEWLIHEDDEDAKKN